MLNGESDGHQMVLVIGFPSMDVHDNWHSSPDYRALIPLHEEGSVQRMMAYEGGHAGVIVPFKTTNPRAFTRGLSTAGCPAQ